MTKEKNVNVTFRILSAIGIVLVVAGHADFQIFDVGGLFPYYSFHVALFLFISGYFYSEDAEEHVGEYIKKKALRLMVPYLVWNLFYGVLAAALRGGGFLIGAEVSLWTLFVEPFLGGHQFGYNFPAWFVPALFLIEVLNIWMRKILSFLRLRNQWLITGLSLLAGMLTVWFAIGGHVWGYYKFPGRILFMFPAWQMGLLYREKLEKWDRLPDGIYFGVLLAVQMVIVSTCGGLAYSTVWCTSFANGPVIPYLTTITGIAFWLRIAKKMTPLWKEGAWMDKIGKNTWAIMMHHAAVFMLVKGVFCLLAEYTSLCADFDKTMYLADIGYLYVPGGIAAFKWIYLIAGLTLPLLAAALEKKVKELLEIKKMVKETAIS